MTTHNLFDGLAGRAVAKVMARSNRDAELEAIDVLNPSADDLVVAIGVGPGVGVEALAGRVRSVLGIDPSAVMIEEATRRCRGLIDAGIVQLGRRDAADIPLPDGSADGAVAVNSIQLWEPLDVSIAEVARVLRPGGRLVTLTHDWAIRRSHNSDIETWFAETSAVCARHSLVSTECRRAHAEGGRSVVFTARRAGA